MKHTKQRLAIYIEQKNEKHSRLCLEQEELREQEKAVTKEIGKIEIEISDLEDLLDEYEAIEIAINKKIGQ